MTRALQELGQSENVPPNGQDSPDGRTAQAAAEGTPSKARRCVSEANSGQVAAVSAANDILPMLRWCGDRPVTVVLRGSLAVQRRLLSCT